MFQRAFWNGGERMIHQIYRVRLEGKTYRYSLDWALFLVSLLHEGLFKFPFASFFLDENALVGYDRK